MTTDPRLIAQRDNLKNLLIPRGEALVAAGVDARPEGMTEQQFESVVRDLAVMQQHLAELEAVIEGMLADGGTIIGGY